MKRYALILTALLVGCTAVQAQSSLQLNGGLATIYNNTSNAFELPVLTITGGAGWTTDDARCTQKDKVQNIWSCKLFQLPKGGMTQVQGSGGVILGANLLYQVNGVQQVPVVK